MKKMMLLALMVAFAALMLAAAPAFATHKCTPSENHQEDCEDQDHDNDNDDDGDDDDDDDNGNDIDSRLINRLNNVGNLEVSPTFEASQETEQDCDTDEVSQPITVNGGGENSIQTVGLNPSANTGCAQTAVDVLDFDPTLAVQGGDFAFNADQFNVIQDNDCDGEDDDGDGRHDEDNFNCDDNGDDNGNHNGDDNSDDNGDDNGDDGVEINDRDSFRFGPDRQIINGGGGDEFNLDEIGSSIGVGGDLTVNGGGKIQQAAAASSQQFVPWPWWVK